MSNEAMKNKVLSCLKHGRDLANTRQWISMHTGIHDRKVRELIEELRNEGYLICNLQNGSGYYLAETTEEILQQYRQDCNRAMSILRRIKPFRHALLEAAAEESDQMTFNEIMNSVFEEGEDPEWLTD